MQHISRQTRSQNKPAKKSGQRDKLPAKPKQTQAMETTITPQKYHTGGSSMRDQNKGGPSAPRRPSLSERQNQNYSFPAEEVEDLFVGLRELDFIELPKPKRPEEALLCSKELNREIDR